MARPNKRVASRIAALVLLIAVIQMAGFGLGYPLLLEYRSSYAEFTRNVDALHGYQRVTGHEATLRQRIATLKRDRSLEDLLLPPGSDSGATAAMQDRVQSIIGSAGAWLTSVQPLPATLEEGHRRIGLRVAFTSDIGALRDILLELEQGRPVMILERVNVHARTSRAVGAAYPLEVRIDVYAFKPEGA